MLKTFLRYIFLGLFAFNAADVQAQEHENKPESEEKDLKTEIKEEIQHHLQDSHYFTLLSDENDHFGIPLPVILWDNGLKIFSASKFHHGETVAQVNGSYYTLYHNKIYKTDAEGTIHYDEAHHPTNAKPLDFSITKNVIGILIASLLLFWLFSSQAKSYAKNGGIASGVGRFLEPIVLFVRDEIAIPNIGEKHYKKYLGYLLTVFFFIWILNLMGMTPLGFNVTGNIAVTFALAILTFLITNFTANKNYWAHIFWMPGTPIFIRPLLAIIELLGLFIKPFALMIRLYANISAGHIVLMSLIGLIFIFKSWLGSSLSFLLSFSISLIEFLVALIQAYIFTMLSALYFGMAKEEHHAEEAH